MSDETMSTGGSVHRGDPVLVDRYTAPARMNHWVTAISLVLLAASGLSLFHPSLFFLSSLFGGGSWTRVVHPWIGVVLFVSFLGMFLRFWRLNLFNRDDRNWLFSPRAILTGHEENLAEIGTYNAGQKLVFWLMSLLIVVLIVSGILMWEEYFGSYFSITQKRVAILAHAVAAIGAICVWIVHIYAAIWVRGTMSAMTRGQVTGGWAWRHHRKWLRELVSKR